MIKSILYYRMVTRYAEFSCSQACSSCSSCYCYNLILLHLSCNLQSQTCCTIIDTQTTYCFQWNCLNDYCYSTNTSGTRKHCDSSTMHSSEKAPFAVKIQNTLSPTFRREQSQHSTTSPDTSSPGVNGGFDFSWYFPWHANISIRIN